MEYQSEMWGRRYRPGIFCEDLPEHHSRSFVYHHDHNSIGVRIVRSPLRKEYYFQQYGNIIIGGRTLQTRATYQESFSCTGDSG